MARKRKDPRYKVAPPTGKRPRLGANPDDVMGERPFWRLERFDVGGPWGRVAFRDGDVLDRILPKMQNFESMTWGQIRANTKRNHFVSKPKLIAQAQKRLDTIRVYEDRLFRFRLSGEERVWGIVDGAVFYVLWWDREHDICPSKKKHT